MWGVGGDNKKTLPIDKLNIQLTILNNLNYALKNHQKYFKILSVKPGVLGW